MCLNGNYSRARIGKSPHKDLFEKKGGGLSPLLFIFALQYVIMKVPANQETLKLNDVHQFLVQVNEVNVPGGNKHAINKGTKVLVVASKVVIRRIYEPTKKSDGTWRIKSNEELNKLTGNKNIINYIKSQRLARFGHIHRVPENSMVKKSI
jgi:hypothetical protein